MPNEPSPWKGEPPSSRTRLFIWLGILAGVVVLAWIAVRAFPERTPSGDDFGNAIYFFTFLTVISASVVFSRQFHLREAARNAVLWIAIGAVLGVGYLYRDVFSDFGARLRGEMRPHDPVAAGAHTVVLSADENGDYFAVGEVNGTRVNFLVDTGSSDIVLSPADAQRLGIDTAGLSYIGETETANGTGHGAPYNVPSLALGPIQMSHVDVSINQAPMSSSLLGMSFLRRMKSFEFREGKLYLHW